MDFDKELGARLRRIRQQKHVSQDCLGHWLGVTFQQVQKYESGATRMPAEKLAKCAVMFGVPVGYFFGDSLSESFDERTLRLAAAIAGLPSEDVSRPLYQLVLALYQITSIQKAA